MHVTPTIDAKCKGPAEIELPVFTVAILKRKHYDLVRLADNQQNKTRLMISEVE